ncbi:alpha-amylase family protein [Paraburkholderia solitsugae]
MPAMARPLSCCRGKLMAAVGVPLLVAGCSCTMPDVHVDGIVWQTDNATARPAGNWQLLGVHDLLIQWIVVDDTSFIVNAGMPAVAHLPDMERISREPWARNVILGLAGYQDEKRARANVARLADVSAAVARLPTPLHVTGYYFPVEIDPTWQDAPKLAGILQRLPHPLWVTVYDRSNIGGDALADWLASWLPADVGVFFQDGCGVYAREAHVARTYLDALSSRLGKQRVRVIAEAFRPAGQNTFRPATADELRVQLQAYDGYSAWLFDGPHYVSDTLVRELAPNASARQESSH